MKIILSSTRNVTVLQTGTKAMKKLLTYTFRLAIPSSSTLKMEAANSSDILAPTITPQSVTSQKTVIIIALL
jgi:hypothetical protein